MSEEEKLDKEILGEYSQYEKENGNIKTLQAVFDESIQKPDGEKSEEKYNEIISNAISNNEFGSSEEMEIILTDFLGEDTKPLLASYQADLVIESLKKSLEDQDYKIYIAIIEEKNKSLESKADEITKLNDSFISKLIEGRDFVFLIANNTDILFLEYLGDESKKAYKEFMKQEKTTLLDIMEAAVKNKEFDKVEEMYKNEPLLKEDKEASAMYHYSLYLQTNQNSYDDSVALSLAVDYIYSGRFKDEIKGGITNTSYVSATGVTYPGPIDDYFWKNAERSVKTINDIQADMERNKKEGEEEREWAKGKNPTLGMTTGQVEVSLWGKPEKINRTVNQSKVREQWVYGQGQYLYFTDGILTSFQD